MEYKKKEQRVIGNTPMIKIEYKYKEKVNYIYAKLEYYNLTGSIKDRMVNYIINKAMEKGELKENQAVIEATSGNTGISLAAIGARYNHPVYIFMPDWVSKERVEIMKSYGANIQLYSAKEGGFKKCIKEAKILASKIDGFLLDQFSNKDNILAHYDTTAVEILNKIEETIGAFVSGVGTGGTLMGVGKKLKKINEETLIVAVEPDKMPLLSKNIMISNHKIEGIGDDFVPDLIDRNIIDKVVIVNDDDSINMSRLLSRKLGIGVGISSGANFLASVILKDRVKDNIVTVFVDDNKKYLSTDLAKDVDKNKKFISNNIELMSWKEI